MNSTNIKFNQVIRPAAILDNASATSLCVDTKGAKYCIYLVNLDATDIAVAAMKIQESDTLTDSTTLSSGTDITGLDYTGSFPSATDDNKLYMFKFPVKGRKRYNKLVFTAGDGSTGTYVSAICLLTDNEVHNDDITSFNVAAIKSIP